MSSGHSQRSGSNPGPRPGEGTSSGPKARTLLGTVGVLVLAGLLGLAVQRGWISPQTAQQIQQTAGAGPARPPDAGGTASSDSKAKTSGPETATGTPAGGRAAPVKAEPSSTTAPNAAPGTGRATGTPAVADLFRQRRSDVFVETRGRVERLLEDDRDTRDGSDMHQKFLLRTSDGVTVLVAHNITASPRVPVRVGDTIALRGEYEYSERGGVIHFTHKPKFETRDRSKHGWIEHDGKRYE